MAFSESLTIKKTRDACDRSTLLKADLTNAISRFRDFPEDLSKKKRFPISKKILTSDEFIED